MEITYKSSIKNPRFGCKNTNINIQEGKETETIS